MQCSHCGNGLSEASSVASISGSLCGDECSECYFLCAKCGFYTVGIYWDCFTGEESCSARGPVAPDEAVKKINLIGQCATPWDKKCRCKAHCAYFDGMLD